MVLVPMKTPLNLIPYALMMMLTSKNMMKNTGKGDKDYLYFLISSSAIAMLVDWLALICFLGSVEK